MQRIYRTRLRSDMFLLDRVSNGKNCARQKGLTKRQDSTY